MVVLASVLVADGISFTSFGVADAVAEYERLLALGVEFSQPPVVGGPVTTAVFDDTVDNLIQLASMNEKELGSGLSPRPTGRQN